MAVMATVVFQVFVQRFGNSTQKVLSSFGLVVQETTGLVVDSSVVHNSVQNEQTVVILIIWAKHASMVSRCALRFPVQHPRIHFLLVPRHSSSDVGDDADRLGPLWFLARRCAEACPSGKEGFGVLVPWDGEKNDVPT